jgi:hypothetical protein
LFLFLLLSLSDLGLTWLLVARGGGLVSEGNPVAGWWLTHYGWGGLAAFKFLTVLVVVGLTAVVSRSRPRSGGLILSVACSVLALVVGYSCYLVGGGARAAAEADSPEVEQVRAKAAELDREWDKCEEYHLALEQLSADLAAGRRSLNDATAQLSSTRQGRDASWLHHLQIQFPNGSDAECLAGNLALHTILLAQDDPAEAERLARRLEQDLTASFGESARWDYRHLLSLAGVRAGVEAPYRPADGPLQRSPQRGGRRLG